MKFPTLYKRTSTGAIQEWTVIADGDSYYSEEGIVSGKLTASAPHTCEVKNKGKKNETTAAQQAEKEAQAEWEKKLRRGYTLNKDQIDNVTFAKPMKGDKWADREAEVTFPVDVQDKLNGVRCQNTRLRSYSTGDKDFHTIPHIRAALAPIFTAYPNAFIDGELFNTAHKANLNRLIKLVSVVMQPKDLTPELLADAKEIVQLHVFDGYGFKDITKDTPFKQRHVAVTKLITELKSLYIFTVPSIEVKDLPTLIQKLVANKTHGGEGLMVRWGTCEYKNGRSKYMLKLKHFQDAEFEIVDVQEGNADWKGAAKRVILRLPKPATNETKDTTFASNIEGDREWLRSLYNRRSEVIGQPATCEFQCWSEYGIPQLPWVRAIRNYE